MQLATMHALLLCYNYTHGDTMPKLHNKYAKIAHVLTENIYNGNILVQYSNHALANPTARQSFTVSKGN